VGLRLNVTLYRVMAYVTGVILVLLCVLAILQVAVHDEAAVNLVGTVHGLLYIVYLLVSYPLTRRLRLRAWPTTVAVLLAGTIPVMTFVVERRISRRYIDPALAAENGQPTAPGGTRQARQGAVDGGAADGGAADGGAAAPPASATPGATAIPRSSPDPASPGQ
jgi:integral membrane protein